jgi:hypothetical protein
MTLHEAIGKLLKQKGNYLTARQIADELNQNKWYQKGNGSSIQPSQIRARVNNYPALFDVNGSLISLRSAPLRKSTYALSGYVKPSNGQTKAVLKPLRSSDNTASIEKLLLKERNFKSAALINDLVPVNSCGLYCIRIANLNRLPSPFDQYLRAKGHNIVYIGIARTCLNKRFLNQELRGKGHGTFFRSIGAVLGYKPLKGSLLGKANQRNYTFSLPEKTRIIEWINQNLLVNWISFSGDFETLETQLITKYKPLLNLAKNPEALPELTALRTHCVAVATTR